LNLILTTPEQVAKLLNLNWRYLDMSRQSDWDYTRLALDSTIMKAAIKKAVRNANNSAISAKVVFKNYDMYALARSKRKRLGNR
jgi:hypothetical protein